MGGGISLALRCTSNCLGDDVTEQSVPPCVYLPPLPLPPPFTSIASANARKLECQNTLLEEELQAKGKRRTTSKAPDGPMETVRGPGDRGDENTKVCDDKARHPPEMAAMKAGAGSWAGPAPPEARRRVSILEDLERELNKEGCGLNKEGCGHPTQHQQQRPFPMATNKHGFHPAERSGLQPKPVAYPVVSAVQEVTSLVNSINSLYITDSPDQREQNR